MRGFGPREFQLMLLRRMDDFQPDLVADALAAMHASRGEHRAAHHRWQQLQRSTGFDRGVDGLRLVLGPPEADAQRKTAFGPVREQRWRLPASDSTGFGPSLLWPDLRWCVLSGLGGTILHSELVRVPARVPVLPTRDEPPAPWSLVLADVAAQQAVHRDDTVPSRTVLWLPSVPGECLRLTFVWGLLQETVPTPPPGPSPPGPDPTGPDPTGPDPTGPER